MLWWQDGFCRLLAGHGRFVIRYDQRDTGRSTTYEPERPGYTGGDLLADAVAVLDGYRLASAHLVGVSAGGALVQLMALDFPSRVSSLVLISTSPATPGDRSLPPPTAAFAEFMRSASVDWSDADSVIDYLVAYAHLLAGYERRFEDYEVRDLVRRDAERARDSQHFRTMTCSRTRTSPASPCRHYERRRWSSTAPRIPCSTSPRPGTRPRDPERAAASTRRDWPRRAARRLGPGLTEAIATHTAMNSNEQRLSI